MSPIAKTLVRMMDQEQMNMRICTVEDCMKLARQLYGFGIVEFNSVLAIPADWFDYFYEMSFEQMHMEIERMSAIASEHVQRIHNLGYIGKFDV